MLVWDEIVQMFQIYYWSVAPIPLWCKEEVAEILIFAWWHWLYYKFNNISLSSSLTSVDCSLCKTGLSGDFPCTWFSRKEISNPWAIFRIFRSWSNLNKKILVSLYFWNWICWKQGPYKLMNSAYIEVLMVTQGNFLWWCYFWMTKFYLGILETVANIYFGVIVGLVYMYVVNDFWRIWFLFFLFSSKKFL